MTFDFRQIAARVRAIVRENSNLKEDRTTDVVGASLVGHEGDHRVVYENQKINNIKEGRSEHLAMETMGFLMQGKVVKALGFGTALDNPEEAGKAAEGATKVWCEKLPEACRK
jgi:hypothetical protein